jgi:hypothetical protein
MKFCAATLTILLALFSSAKAKEYLMYSPDGKDVYSLDPETGAKENKTSFGAKDYLIGKDKMSDFQAENISLRQMFAVSGDGSTLMFCWEEHDGQIFSVPLERKDYKVPRTISLVGQFRARRSNPSFNQTAFISVENGMSDFSLTPDGEQFCYSKENCSGPYWSQNPLRPQEKTYWFGHAPCRGANIFNVHQLNSVPPRFFDRDWIGGPGEPLRMDMGMGEDCMFGNTGWFRQFDGQWEDFVGMPPKTGPFFVLAFLPWRDPYFYRGGRRYGTSNYIDAIGLKATFQQSVEMFSIRRDAYFPTFSNVRRWDSERWLAIFYKTPDGLFSQLEIYNLYAEELYEKHSQPGLVRVKLPASLASCENVTFDDQNNLLFTMQGTIFKIRGEDLRQQFEKAKIVIDTRSFQDAEKAIGAFVHNKTDNEVAADNVLEATPSPIPGPQFPVNLLTGAKGRLYYLGPNQTICSAAPGEPSKELLKLPQGAPQKFFLINKPDEDTKSPWSYYGSTIQLGSGKTRVGLWPLMEKRTDGEPLTYANLPIAARAERDRKDFELYKVNFFWSNAGRHTEEVFLARPNVSYITDIATPELSYEAVKLPLEIQMRSDQIVALKVGNLCVALKLRHVENGEVKGRDMVRAFWKSDPQGEAALKLVQKKGRLK